MRRTSLIVIAAALAACEAREEQRAVKPPPVTPRIEAPASLTARGTEPFWAVEVRPAQLKLMRPDAADILEPNPGPYPAGAKTLWRTKAFELTVEPGVCSEGMSDTVYPFTAEIRIVQGETMKGCALP